MMLQLNDIYTDAITGGIFTDLYNAQSDAHKLPWDTTATPAQELGMYYHLTRSGDRPVTPIMRLVHDGSITRGDLAKMILVQYADKWARLYNTFAVEYDPIANVDATESFTETHTTQDDTTDNTDHVNGLQVTTNAGTTQTAKNDVYGFNSATAVPSDEQGGTTTTEGTEAHSGTDKDNRTVSATGSHTITHETKRHGNIGVTTTAQLIEGDRRLWIDTFFSYVYSDLDKVMVLSVY